MLAAIYLLVTGLAGFALATRALPTAPVIVRAPAGFLLALIFTSWTTYLVALGLATHTEHALRIGLVVSTLIGAGTLAKFGPSVRRSDLRMPVVDAVVAAISLAFAFLLYHWHLHTVKGELMVGAATWADMGLHIGLARSFAVGSNFPTEYPFFAGEPIHYHFGFDFFAGMLHGGGFSILWAFNLPAILSFASMMTILFATARLLFGAAEPAARWWRDHGLWAGLIAVAVMISNQSLQWLRYVEQDAGGSFLRALDPAVLWRHQDFLSKGPYADDRLVIFNTLPYVGQAHLSAGIAIVLALTYVLITLLKDGEQLDRRLLLGAGIAFGVAFWLNGVVWLAGGIFFAALLSVWALAACRRAYLAHEGAERWPAVRERGVAWLRLGAFFAVPALLLGAPQAIVFGGNGGGGLSVQLGYLACFSSDAGCQEQQVNPLSLHDWWAFVQYWWVNTGIFIPLLITAFVLGNSRDKKLLLAIAALFVWGNVFVVGTDIGGFNHKTFNLWEDLGALYAAFAVVQLWIITGGLVRAAAASRRIAGVVARALLVVAVWLLTVSGLADVMTIKNDPLAGVFGDPAQQQLIKWIAHETPGDATFLTDYGQPYTPATMAGRRLFLGYSPWAASSGYDVAPREQAVAAIYAAPDRAEACRLLTEQQIDVVLVGPQERSSERFELNQQLYDEMTPAISFGDGDVKYSVYRVADNC